jgi:hypothetical protein
VGFDLGWWFSSQPAQNRNFQLCWSIDVLQQQLNEKLNNRRRTYAATTANVCFTRQSGAEVGPSVDGKAVRLTFRWLSGHVVQHSMSSARALVSTCLAAIVLSNASAAAAQTPSTVAAPPRRADQKAVSPDARRFMATPSFAYWAGTERVFDGELALATPRPLSAGQLLAAPDDELRTSAFARAARSAGRDGLDWRLLELGSMHDIRGGAVLGTSFRYDEREEKAVQGFVALTVPVGTYWLVPTVGVGAGAAFAPELTAAAELRSPRDRRHGYAVGLEASTWARDRVRLLGTVALVLRLGRRAAIEQRVAAGAWAAPGSQRAFTGRWIVAAEQNLGERFALYQRVTATVGAPALVEDQSAGLHTWWGDAALGFRYSFASTYGAALQADAGFLPERTRRFGGELSVYGTLF